MRRRFQNVNVAFGFQQPLGLDSRHAAGTRRRDGLPIFVILYIARRKDTVNAGSHIVGRIDVAGRSMFQLAREQIGIGPMADGDK